MIVKIEGLVMNCEEKSAPNEPTTYVAHLYQAGERTLAIVKGLQLPLELMEKVELTCKAYPWANDRGMANISLKVI